MFCLVLIYSLPARSSTYTPRSFFFIVGPLPTTVEASPVPCTGGRSRSGRGMLESNWSLSRIETEKGIEVQSAKVENHSLAMSYLGFFIHLSVCLAFVLEDGIPACNPISLLRAIISGS